MNTHIYQRLVTVLDAVCPDSDKLDTTLTERMMSKRVFKHESQKKVQR